jgi:hypothetical protein
MLLKLLCANTGGGKLIEDNMSAKERLFYSQDTDLLNETKYHFGALPHTAILENGPKTVFELRWIVR